MSWSLLDICTKMLQTPRSQLNIYVNGNIPASRQREAVSYHSTARRGVVKRSTLSDSTGTTVPPDRLYQWLALDLTHYHDCFFTFVTAPIYGLASDSENRDYRQTHQQLMPTPVRFITAAMQ